MGLTNEIREKLLARLLSHGYKAKQDLMTKAYTDFADKCYNYVYTPEIQQTMGLLPKEFFPLTKKIKLSLGGMAFSHVGSVDVPISYFADYGVIARFPADHNLTIEFLNLEKKNDSLKKEIAEAEQNAKALLYSVQTMKRLLKVWPEIEDFTKDIVPEKIGLPAVQIVDLNKKLKLPPSEVIV